jgi:hypothetical protein
MFDTDSLCALTLASPFFCEALTDVFLENGFIREALDERIHFLLWRWSKKKWLLQLPKWIHL